MEEGYKKTAVGNIPIDWVLKTIGDEVRFEGGAQPPKEHFRYDEKEGYIRLIQIRDYKTNEYITYIPKNMARKFCKEDDIMIGRYGPPIFQILKGLEGAYNVALLKAIPNGEVLNKEYVRYFLSTEKLFKLIDRLSQRTSGQTGVDMDALNNYLMPIPPLKEQEKIAEILSTFDCQIYDTEKLIEKSKMLKKGLMQKLLTKGIGHKEFKKTEIGEIPVEWEVKFTKDVFNLVTDYVANGSFASLNENVNYSNEEDYAILIRLTDYKKGYKDSFVYVDEKAYKFLDKSKLESEDIIIANVGSYAGYVFKAPKWEKPMTLGPNAILVRTNEVKDYIYYWMSSDIGQNSIKKIISTTAQPKFNKTDFKKILIPIPSREEQEKIVRILLSVDNEIEEYEDKKQRLEELKKGLMQQLLTGKIRTIV